MRNYLTIQDWKDYKYNIRKMNTRISRERIEGINDSINSSSKDIKKAINSS